MYTSHTKTTPWTTELSNTTENSHPNTSPVLNRCSRTLTLTTISKSAPCHAIRRYLSWKNSLLMRKHSGNLWNRPFARHVRNLSRQGYWKAEILRKTLSENWTALKKKYYVQKPALRKQSMPTEPNWKQKFPSCWKTHRSTTTASQQKSSCFQTKSAMMRKPSAFTATSGT